VSDDEHEKDPPSIPAVLTDGQIAAVWAALDTYVKGKSKAEIAEALGYRYKYVNGVLVGTIRPSVHFAIQLARAAGLDIEALLNLEGGGP